MTADTDNTKLFRILAVDDEPAVLQAYQTILGNSPQEDANADEVRQLADKLFADNSAPAENNETASKFELVTASQGAQAVETVQQAINEDRPFALVFLDVRMPPGIDGVETAKQIRQMDPDIQIVIVTGFSDISPSEIAVLVPPADKLLYLQKPFHNHEIWQLASAMTQKWSVEKTLRNINNQLEVQVRHRTAELSKSNMYLAEEMVQRQEAQAQIEKAHGQLKDQSVLRDEFVINVSHELRTPLCIFRNIISNISSGLMGPVTEKQVENLEIVDQEIDRLGRIISDFLDITRIESGKLTIDRQLQPLQPIILDAVKLIQPLANDKRVEVVTSMPDDELTANVDRDRIIQILTNLIDNAVRYTPEIGAKITVRLKDLDGEIGIDVEDNGRGIESDDISKVFNRFVQVEKQTGPGAHGTGLGLAISKELIEAHAGRIWAENLPTGGANFCLALPKPQNARLIG